MVAKKQKGNKYILINVVKYKAHTWILNFYIRIVSTLSMVLHGNLPFTVQYVVTNFTMNSLCGYKVV